MSASSESAPVSPHYNESNLTRWLAERSAFVLHLVEKNGGSLPAKIAEDLRATTKKTIAERKQNRRIGENTPHNADLEQDFIDFQIKLRKTYYLLCHPDEDQTDHERMKFIELTIHAQIIFELDPVNANNCNSRAKHIRA